MFTVLRVAIYHVMDKSCVPTRSAVYNYNLIQTSVCKDNRFLSVGLTHAHYCI